LSTAALPAGLERVLPLLDPARRPRSAEFTEGYLDLLGAGVRPRDSGRAQQLMFTRAVPLVYERWWRPALGRIAKGPLGPGMEEEKRIARLLLGIEAGDGILDVACGPGNFTREFARLAGPAGLVVGFGASTTMLARAVRDTGEDERIAYVRGDAGKLPFRDASFDGVCCFAALHMLADPWTALDEMTRVLTPGGRIALLTSCRTRTAPARTRDGWVGARTGQRMFERDEVVEALTDRGFEPVRRRIAGLTQFVGGRLAV
jgi:ubiquinone/menaquinone biosynthesis C-methylase UbiE